MDDVGFSLLLFHHAVHSNRLDEAVSRSRMPANLAGRFTFDLAHRQYIPDAPQPFPSLLLLSFNCAVDPQTAAELRSLVDGFVDAGLMSAPSAHFFDWIRPLVTRPGVDPQAMTHLSVVMATATLGMDEEYLRYYDEHHVPETLAIPGSVAFRRGRLSAPQLFEKQSQPYPYVVLMSAAPDDFEAMIDEVGARAKGTSASGMRFHPRSPAVGDKFAIHYFARRQGGFGSI